MMNQNKPNIFVIGSGRNGTSMVAGLFSQSGYYFGDQLHKPSAENPKGYFEDATINQLNNRILSRYLPNSQIIGGIEYLKDSPENKNGRLSRIPLGTKIEALPNEQAVIDKMTGNTPFCFKDTRFCYLLPLWSQNTANERIVCVFRQPQLAVASTLKCCVTRAELAEVAISVNQAFEIWTLMYSHVLEKYANKENCFFIENTDILNGRSLNALEDFCETKVDRSFPSDQLNRTISNLKIPQETASIYVKLQCLASACY